MKKLMLIMLIFLIGLSSYVSATPVCILNNCTETFTSNGTFTVPSGITTVDILVVAGGGGGGGTDNIGGSGGGGGAGGMIYITNYYNLTKYGGSVNVTIGNGGAGGVYPSSASGIDGSNGENSKFGNLTAIGGGGGRGNIYLNGKSGGSGGGGAYDHADHFHGSGGSATQTSTNDGFVGTGFGNSGQTSYGIVGGNGGGCGGTPTGQTIWGTTYCTGGNGGSNSGGANGGSNSGNGGAGKDYSTSGGSGYSGGSGIVVVKYSYKIATIQSPINNANYSTNSVDLNWSIDTNTSWCAYSLDGAANNTNITSNLCYQETANVSTACGGLATGNYKFYNNGGLDLSNAIDGNYSSYVESNASIIINYTKPSNASNSSLWQVKYRNGFPLYTTYTSNISIPADCFNQNQIIFNITSGIDALYFSNYSCLNSTGWHNLFNTDDDLIFEEAMWWNISSSNTNITLTSLSEGRHNITIWCNDTSGNMGQSAYTYFLTDTIPPYFTTIPANQTLTYGTAFNASFSAADATSSIANFTINYTSLFSINRSGWLRNTTKIGVGIYDINVTINDTVGWRNSTMYRLNVTQASAQTSLTFSVASPQNYGTSFTPTCSILSGVGTTSLTRNGTSTSGAQSLGVGNYLFNCSLASSQNYTYAENTSVYIINQASTSITARLNGNTANLTVIYLQPVNASGTSSFGTLNIYRNGTSITNGANYTLGAGYYFFNYSIIGNENYTTNESYLYANITPNTGNCNMLFNTTSPVSEGLSFKAYTDCTSGFQLFRNGTSITNNSVQTLALGSYNFTVYRNDTQNYTNTADTETFNIVDTTKPTIDFTSPTENNNTNWSRNWIAINVSIYDINYLSTNISLYNTTGYVNSSNLNYTNFTNLPDGLYYYNATATDTSGNTNRTLTRYITIDDTNPTANLLSPANNTLSNNASYNLTVNLTDNLGIKNASLYINGTLNSTTTFASGTTSAIIGWVKSLATGVWNWMVNVFDWSGNSYQTENYTLRVDYVNPLWSNNQTNISATTKTGSSVWFSINLSDNLAGLNYSKFSWYNGSIWSNTTYSLDGNLSIQLNITKTITATRSNVTKWYWWFNDSAGNINQTNIWNSTIANTAPVTNNPLLSTPNPYTKDTLTCSVNSYSDADSDANAGNSWRWYKNDALISGQTASTLNLATDGNGNKGDIINCEWRATDGYDYSGWSNSTTPRTIQNTAPTLTVDLSFTNFTAGHSFNVTATFHDDDNSSDFASRTISNTTGACYYVSNTTTTENITLRYNCTGTALTSTSIQINATDGSGSRTNSSIMVNSYPNQAPTMTSAQLNKTTGVIDTDDLLCNATGKADADGDATSYFYEWYNNSIAKGINNNVLISTNLTTGDVWYCEAWATDTYANSSKYTSSSVIIGSSDTAPTIIQVDAWTQNSGVRSNNSFPTRNDSWINFSILFTDTDANAWTGYICSSSNFGNCRSNLSGNQLCKSGNNLTTNLSCIYNVTGSTLIGLQTAYAFVLDNTSLHTPGSLVNFEVNHPPTTPILVAPIGNVTSNHTIINFTASDLDSDVINYTIFVNNAPGINLCYQETANVSTACGGLATGSYYFLGGWDNPNNVIDGNWSSLGSATYGQSSYLFINYTKPIGALNSSLWQVKEGLTQPDAENLTLSNSCFNQDPIQLKINSTLKFGYIGHTYYCWDGSGWAIILYEQTNYEIYEEAMWWNLSNTLQSNSSNYYEWNNLNVGTYFVQAYTTDQHGYTGTYSQTYNFTVVPNYNTKINSVDILPYTPDFATNISIRANITDDYDVINWVNFTLTSPSGTKYINSVNGTRSTGDYWISSYFRINETGTWTYNVTSDDVDDWNNTNPYSDGSFTITDVITIDRDTIDVPFLLGQAQTKVFDIGVYTDSVEDLNFTVTHNLDNNFTVTITPNNTQVDTTEKYFTVSITSKISSTLGNHTGTINVTRLAPFYNLTQIPIKIEITTSIGDVEVSVLPDLIRTECPSVIESTFILTNLGNYQVSNCRSFYKDYTNQEVGYASETGYSIDPGAFKSIKMSYAYLGAYAEYITFNTICVATPTGTNDTLNGTLPSIYISPKPSSQCSGGDSSGGGGGNPPVLPPINITEIIANYSMRCGDFICQDGGFNRTDNNENPWNCPEDCIQQIWELEDIFCMPIPKCGNWSTTWFINLMILLIFGFLIIFQIQAKKVGRLN